MLCEILINIIMTGSTPQQDTGKKRIILAKIAGRSGPVRIRFLVITKTEIKEMTEKKILDYVALDVILKKEYRPEKSNLIF